jgi:hypothetical protein
MIILECGCANNVINLTIKKNTMADLTKTEKQFDTVIATCKNVFMKKAEDYGLSWKILRLPSITDQIFIKAKRIRTLEESGVVKKVNEDIDVEYAGIINYCVIALIVFGEPAINLEQFQTSSLMMNGDVHRQLSQKYDAIIQQAKDLMLKKNHDYDEAWRSMRTSSYSDLILTKILRIKQIEENRGKVKISEGIDSNYFDILVYSVFALIRLSEK